MANFKKSIIVISAEKFYKDLLPIEELQHVSILRKNFRESYKYRPVSEALLFTEVKSYIHWKSPIYP